MTWTPVCRYDDLQPERGIAALVGDEQVALFRAFDGTLYAIGNQDPYTGVFVLSRGIVGTRGDIPTVTSPLHKQAFDLRTGTCLDDQAIRVPVFPVRRRAGQVEIQVEIQVRLVEQVGTATAVDAEIEVKADAEVTAG